MYYRLYRFQSGRIQQAADIACASDEEARRVAEKIHDGRAMELWHGVRKVAGWPEIPRSGFPGVHATLGASVLGSTRPSGRSPQDGARG